MTGEEQNATAPPQFSPDGKWWWDGAAWQPVPTAPPTANGSNDAAAAPRNTSSRAAAREFLPSLPSGKILAIAAVAVAAVTAVVVAHQRTTGVAISGHVLLDNLLASSAADLDCSRIKMRVDIKDGSGRILKVISGPTNVSTRQGNNGHTFASCQGTYSARVPHSSVYVIESEYFADQITGKRVSINVDSSELKDGRAPDLVLLYNPIG